MIISTRLVELVIDTVVCLTLAKWETVSGQFGGYLSIEAETLLQVVGWIRQRLFPSDDTPGLLKDATYPLGNQIARVGILGRQ